MSKITPFLWFNTNAEEAMNFYVSLFKSASIGNISRYGPGGPGPEGSVMVASFELEGQQFAVLNGGPMYQFTEAVSFVINCDTQEEVDHFWNALTADGGQESRCGWLKDRFGLSWQVVPTALPKLLSNPDKAKAGRAMQAMMGMNKLDIKALEEA
ncbi:MAG: 3-demethylubiquinone-9 3-methyltransferase [Flaviaesturariibacter sp.]|nr:3-demethylubiquinone-9 3-methyltransferase [Flaviaesturariibacter sp.]